MRYFLQILILCVFLTSCKEGKKNKSEEIIAPAAQVKEEVKVATKEADTLQMVHFKGGTIFIGSYDGLPNEKPVFEKTIKPFYIDKNLVTVGEFRKFITETGYQTDADKFGDSGVFLFDQGQWQLLPGANWEYPLGRSSKPAIDNHPVTQVSWTDANAYAKWAGKRLPTEFEWEFAAKNGKNSNQKYAWGDQPVMNNKYMANVWQGATLADAATLDGYLLTSPVGAFGLTESGLTDMGGNVWQWCENSYASYPGNKNPEPTDPKIKSTRGGSFMFDQALEDSYTTTFRGKNSLDTSLFNTGFRCAK